MPAGGEGSAIVVERAEKALVVRAKDADTEAVGFAAALPPEPSRTTVVVDASAADALHALDERLLDELVKRLYADSPPGWEMRLVAARTGRPDPSGAPPLAARLADRLGVGVVAPDGELIALRGGELFSAGPGAGWLGFRRGAHPEWTGPRYPAPAWQAALPREFRTAKPRAFARFRDRRSGGRPVTVTAIPAGLWVRGAGTAPLPLVDLGFGVPVEAARPIVLVGAPGERGPGVAELTAFYRSLPSDVRENAVLVPYGQAPETCATLAQGLADRLETTVRAYHALPHYATDGTRRFAVFNESGTPERLTQTPESVYPPAGAAQPRPWAAPYAGPEVHRPGVMDAVPGRRREDREEDDVDPVVFESSIDTPTQPIAALEESAYAEPPAEESWTAVVTVDAHGTMRPVIRPAHGRGTDPWTILPSPRPEARNAAPEPVAGEQEFAAAEREPAAAERAPVAVAAGERDLAAGERVPAAEREPVTLAAGDREPVTVAVNEPEPAAARTSAPAPPAVPAPSAVPAASSVPAASAAPVAPAASATAAPAASSAPAASAAPAALAAPAASVAPAASAAHVALRTTVSTALPQTRPATRRVPMRGEPAGRTPDRLSPRAPGETPGTETAWPEPAAPGDRSAPAVRDEEGYPGRPEDSSTGDGSTAGPRPAAATDVPVAGSWKPPVPTPAAGSGKDGDWSSEEASWALPAPATGETGVPGPDTPGGTGSWDSSDGAAQGQASAGSWEAPAVAGTVPGPASGGFRDASADTATWGMAAPANAGPPSAEPVGAGREIAGSEWPAVERGAGVAGNTPEAGGAWQSPETLPPADTRMAAPAVPSWDAPATREPRPAAGGPSDANPSASGPRSAWPPSAAPSPETPQSANVPRSPQAAPPGDAPVPQERARPAATGPAGTPSSWDAPGRPDAPGLRARLRAPVTQERPSGGPATAGPPRDASERGGPGAAGGPTFAGVPGPGEVSERGGPAATGPVPGGAPGPWEAPVAREHGGPVAAGGYRGPSPVEVAGGWSPAAPNGRPPAAPDGQSPAVSIGQPSAAPTGRASGASFEERAGEQQPVAFVEPAPGVPPGTRPGAPLGASLGARQPGAYVPARDYDRLWLADRVSTPDERQAFRSALGWRYDAATRAVARLLAEHPGLRSAELDEALMTEFAAVRVFAGRDEAAMVESIRAGGHGDDRALAVCAAGGLRRLPALQGVVVRGGPADPGAADAYRLGQDLVEAAPIIALDDLDASVPGGVELLIWSATARRLDGFAEGRPVQEVIFLPGTVFRVVAVDPPGDAPVRRVLLTEVPPGKAGPGREKWAARVTARLEEAAANRTAPPADPDDRFAPLPGDPARSMP